MDSATIPARLRCKYRGKSSNGNVYLCSCERESMCTPTCKVYSTQAQAVFSAGI